MNKELTDKLLIKYPFYTKNYSHFPFECEDGWFDMLDKMSQEIQDIIEETGFDTFSVFQVKEKYATLRYYPLSTLPEIDVIIDRYEEISGTICEVCGEKGEIRKKGFWYKTLCDKDYSEWN